MFMTYTFYSDPGHSWMAVTLAELIKLRIVDKISICSYWSKSGTVVFLEEDCDASIFLERKKELEQEFKIKEEHIDQDHWIRNLKPFGV